MPQLAQAQHTLFHTHIQRTRTHTRAQDVARALDQAAQVGVDSSRCTQALAAARARDAQMAADLRALAAAPVAVPENALPADDSADGRDSASGRDSVSGSDGEEGAEAAEKEGGGGAGLQRQQQQGAATATGSAAAGNAGANAGARTHDAAAFAALCARALGLGLRGDVAAARGVLDVRRRALAERHRAALAVLAGAAAPAGGGARRIAGACV